MLYNSPRRAILVTLNKINKIKRRVKKKKKAGEHSFWKRINIIFPKERHFGHIFLFHPENAFI